MCGIVAWYHPDGRLPDRAWLEAAAAALQHRGPDDAGFLIEPGVGLAFRRLSIVDVAGGHQPLANEDGSIWIVYNGEIYNHAELRRELESLGHRYRSHSDTETIVHAYEQWGEAALGRLRGMFAFALWDRPRRRMLVARDRIGIKPLYWTDGRRVRCASEAKALFAFREWSARSASRVIEHLTPAAPRRPDAVLRTRRCAWRTRRGRARTYRAPLLMSRAQARARRP
jgi:asparagine synthase (glutamine-hydrolysing)